LLFEPVSGLPNVIPILDAGEWQDYYVLVMPLAEKSLRQHVSEAEGKLTTEETIRVLIDVAEALVGLQGVVHRDLKPENVLWYQGHWCVADFGIARYAEATTAPDTRKYALTPAYAAPEQWRAERATAATDVYAFGVMAFELLQGQRPFPGPDLPDFREQHLTQTPPALIGCPPSVASLVTECLYKAAQARPTAANILARLHASQRAPSPAAARLQAANQKVVDKQAQEAAWASAEKSAEQRRTDLFAAARQSLEPIIDSLIARVQEAAPSATGTRAGDSVVRLGDAVLAVDQVRSVPGNCLASPLGPPPFDVIAYSAIAARKLRDRYGYEGRSHSLWFCDAHDEGTYRWFETAFMVTPGMPQSSSIDPFALRPTDKDAAGAFSPAMAVRQVAWQPVPFNQGDEEQFIERWLEWFAAAVDGTLRHPSHMPEDSGGRYRRSRPR
ncbi:MAG: serine/threonine protein kinase, partial [Chloroflexi bacterium]|nr:serine/threonine protein kinase [Chloroflexota bacterium]